MIKKAALAISFLLLSTINAHGAELPVPDRYATIQEAVNAASPSDTVVIRPGAYRENIIIKKTLTIRSSDANADTTIVAAKRDEPVILVEDVTGTVIEGLTLTGSDVAGVRINRSTDTAIRSNHLDENSYGAGLYESNNNTIEGNTADRNENYGIYLEKSHGNTIARNSASSNGDKGIFISSSNGNTIVKNTANLNTWNGIVLWSSKGNIIRGNKTLRNTYGLVLTESTDNTVEDNTSLPNVFIILPILLIYLGILSYIIQKYALKSLYRS